MKPIIPKSPEVPELNSDDINFLTDIVFGTKIEPKQCDVIFIFSGTHPGHWKKAIEAFKNGYAKKIIVTGGKSKTGIPHPDWDIKKETESEIIIAHLLDAGVPLASIISENISSNSLENVIYAKEVFDFNTVEKIMYICKSHAAGRQGRTLAKHIPSHIQLIPYTFDTSYHDITVSRDIWMNSEEGRSRVWGEYLRILYYGEKGNLVKLEIEDER